MLMPIWAMSASRAWQREAYINVYPFSVEATHAHHHTNELTPPQTAEEGIDSSQEKYVPIAMCIKKVLPGASRLKANFGADLMEVPPSHSARNNGAR